MQVILGHLSPNQERVTAYFNPQALLTTQNIDLGAGYAVGGEKPYPWGSEILENIERVERKDDSSDCQRISARKRSKISKPR